MRAASRSAKKIWRWAFACSPFRSCMKEVAFALERFADRKYQRIAQRLNSRRRRMQAAAAPGMLGHEPVELCRIAAQRRQQVFAVARPRQRTLLGQYFTGEGDTGRGNIAIGDLVDQPGILRFRGRDRIAGQDHAHRLVHSDQARELLRAAGAGEEAELDLRQTEPRAR